jgi:hypothetical protein
LAAAVAARTPAAAQPVPADTLGDQTILRHWTLPNGLRVVVRDLPGSGHVALTVAFPVGSDHDPPGKEGAARLLADLYLTAGAGEMPDRTREDLGHQRPAGWGLQVSPRLTLFTEVASRAQLPEVLHEAALRLGGVEVTPEVYKRSQATVGRLIADVLFNNPASALYFEVRDVGRGVSDEVRLRLASGRGAAAVSLQEARRRLAEHYGPADAVLSMAGDVGGLDLEGMVRNFFAPLPARGAAPPSTASDTLRATRRASSRPSVRAPLGVVGAIAPALDDTLHPSFYLATLLLGSSVRSEWGAPQPPLTTRFEFVLFDDPSLARFYPPADPGDLSGASLSQRLTDTVNRSLESTIPLNMVEQLRSNLAWMLGGDLPEGVKRNMQQEPTSLATLANTAAARELWGGEAFWAGYRRHFVESPRTSWVRALEMLGDPRRHVVLQYNPRTTR